MREYSYIASKKDGSQIRGVRKGNSSQEIAQYLHDNNLMVISIQESIGINFGKLGDIQIGGLPLKERMMLTKQLSTMIGAGVPLVQALDVLVTQAKNRSLKSDLQKIYKDVQAGTPLSKSIERNSKIYDELQVSLVEAGEKSGNLVEVLKQIAIDLEKRNQLASKLRGAMIYPVIIFIIMVVVMVVMTVFMIPAVTALYEDFGVDENSLPFVTKMFVKLSDFVTNPVGGGATIIIVIASLIGARAYYSSLSGRRVIDKFLLKMPIFGQIFEYSQVVQMTRLLAMLIKSGLSIIDALNTVAKSASNILYKEALKEAVLDVSKGTPLAVSLSKTNVVPVILVKMIAIGEDTGTLDKMLTDMSIFYETELNNLTENLTKLMEPVILLVVGVIVGILAVAIYLPIYQITQF